MTRPAKKPRIRKPKASPAGRASETVATEPAPMPVCPECRRRLEIEETVRRQVKDTLSGLERALEYLGGHNYTTILAYLSNANGSLSLAIASIRILYQEQEAARQKVSP